MIWIFSSLFLIDLLYNHQVRRTDSAMLSTAFITWNHLFINVLILNAYNSYFIYFAAVKISSSICDLFYDTKNLSVLINICSYGVPVINESFMSVVIIPFSVWCLHTSCSLEDQYIKVIWRQALFLCYLWWSL